MARLEARARPSNVRISTKHILTFDGFFGAKFDVLKPRWLPTSFALRVEFGGGCDDENLLLRAVAAMGDKDLGAPRERVRERHGGSNV